MIRFDRTQELINIMDSILHLFNWGVKEDFLKDHFTRYTLIFFFSEVEDKLRERIGKEYSEITDKTNIFKFLGDNYGTGFLVKNLIKPSKERADFDIEEVVLTLFDNLKSARNKVAHQANVQITISWNNVNGEWENLLPNIKEEDAKVLEGKNIVAIGEDVVSAIEKHLMSPRTPEASSKTESVAS